MRLPFRLSLPRSVPERDGVSRTPASETASGNPASDAASDPDAPTAADPQADANLKAEATSRILSAPDSPIAATGANDSDERVLLQVAEEAWRLGRRIDRAAGEVGEAPLADVRDALQRLCDILAEVGVEAVDHDGERYVDGLRLHVLHVEGKPAADASLRVLRTIRPSILAHGQVAAGGQVILGPADQEKTTP